MLSSISFQSSMRFVRTTSSTPGSNRACRSVSARRSSNDLLNQNFKAWDQCDRQRSCPSFLTCRTSGSQAGSTGRRLGVLLQPLFQQTSGVHGVPQICCWTFTSSLLSFSDFGTFAPFSQSTTSQIFKGEIHSCKKLSPSLQLCKAATENSLTFLLNRRASTFR